MALTTYYVCARGEGRKGKLSDLAVQHGGWREREKEKRNARYANTEHQAFGFACYRCHGVVDVRVEAGKSTQVCLKRRRECLQGKVRVRIVRMCVLCMCTAERHTCGQLNQPHQFVLSRAGGDKRGIAHP
jgi:hypothetical protein